MFRHHFRVLALVYSFIWVSLGACGPDRGSSPPRTTGPTKVAELVVMFEVGVESDGNDWRRIFHRPLDATFSGDAILVLDSSPPWVRAFSTDGRYLRAMVDRGEGPGEVGFPYSLRGTADGGFLVTHSRGIERLDAAGRPVFSSMANSFWSRGAVEACGGEVFSLARRPGEIGAPGLLMRVEPDGSVEDTVAVFDTIRLQSSLRRRSASFLRAGNRGILLYPEELNRHRLVWVGCDGLVQGEVGIYPLGAPQRTGLPPVGEQRPGRFAVRPAEPPFPGGMVEVGNRILWATLVAEQNGDGSVDSVTVLTAFGRTQGTRSLTIDGWMQLFDSDQEGRLLVGNADGLIPSVLVVEGTSLLKTIDEEGTVSR